MATNRRSVTLNYLILLSGALVAGAPAVTNAQDCTPQWAEGVFCPEGLDGIVRDIWTSDVPGDETIFVAGEFLVDCEPASVAMWDGSAWTALGQLFGGTVEALAMYDDGVFGMALYAGGWFSTAGGTPAAGIARWDGSSWTQVGSSGLSGVVHALQVFDSGSGPMLYAGGQFSGTRDLARWNGSSWTYVQGSPSGVIRTLHVSDLDINSGAPTVQVPLPDFSVSFITNTPSFNFNQATDIGPITGVSFEGTVAGISGNPATAGELGIIITPPQGAQYRLGTGIFVPPTVATPWDFDGPQSTLDGTYRHGVGGEQWSGDGLPDPGLMSPVSAGLWRFDFGVTSPLILNLMNWSNAKITVHGSGSSAPSDRPWLYVGGEFFSVGSAEANNVARFDGSTWAPIVGAAGNGVTSTDSGYVSVRSLLVADLGQGPELLVGGEFDFAGQPAPSPCPERYDPDTGTWLPGCPTDLPCETSVCDVLPYCCDEGWYLECELLAYALCTDAVIANGFARYRGGEWYAPTNDLGGALIDPFSVVSDIEVYDDGGGEAIYLIGDIQSYGGSFGPNWNGFASVAKLSNGTLSNTGTYLYRDNLEGGISAAAVHETPGGPMLFIGSSMQGVFEFDNAFVPLGGLGAVTGSGWEAVGYQENASTIGGRIETLHTHNDGDGDALYAGGRFITAGGTRVNSVARWDGTDWLPLPGSGDIGVDNRVLGLATYDDGSGPALYAGGFFFRAGGTIVNRIAKWDGTDWSALSGPSGAGVNGGVWAVTTFDDGTGPALYAGGSFSTAGGITANGIAKWDGTRWWPLEGPSGTGVNGFIVTMETFDDGSGPALYAGGFFTTAGGVTANQVAKWDGTQWSALAGPGGVGTNGAVRKLTVFDDGTGPALYAGGSFTTAGGISVNRVAKWDGAEWSPLTGPNGVGVNGTMTALATFDDGTGSALYAGGLFGTAGGTSVSLLAKWDGEQWSRLSDPNTPSSVSPGTDFRDAAVFNDGGGDALYFAGEFEALDGIGSVNIAKWQGCSPVQPTCPPDLNGDGLLNFFDITRFIQLFNDQDPLADFDDNGTLNFFDISTFLTELLAGCE